MINFTHPTYKLAQQAQMEWEMLGPEAQDICDFYRANKETSKIALPSSRWTDYEISFSWRVTIVLDQDTVGESPEDYGSVLQRHFNQRMTDRQRLLFEATLRDMREVLANSRRLTLLRKKLGINLNPPIK